MLPLLLLTLLLWCACVQVCGVLGDAVLPALTQHYSNLGLAHMVWDVMAHMTFPFRAKVSSEAIFLGGGGLEGCATDVVTSCLEQTARAC